MTEALWALFLPLMSAGVSGAFGRFMSWKFSYLIAILTLCLSVVLSFYLLHITTTCGFEGVMRLLPWITMKSMQLYWSIKIDAIVAVMLCVINTISLLVHIYAMDYMKKDRGCVRFVAYISLFTFFMLLLVTANDLLQLFVGWEGVGLVSYLLIGFWHHKPLANSASFKALIVNRFGDFALILGIALTYHICGSVVYDDIIAKAPLAKTDMYDLGGTSISVITLITFLWFAGCMGKSAQIGLHVWLPDAMEGPTPVSALIHSATMVTAGVFLVVRLSSVFSVSDVTSTAMLAIGAVTAFFAGTAAITQNDIKRVIAYSTCSQLGLMFMGVGASAYAASLFHLTTHACFKSLFFLGAGVIINATTGEHNIQKMGGLRTKLPLTHVLMVLASLSLTGVPFFSGAYSKEAILAAVWGNPLSLSVWMFWLGVLGVFFTALYTWRLMILIFYGKTRVPHIVFQDIHEANLFAMLPLCFLGCASVFLGSMGVTYFLHQHDFWGATLGIKKMLIEIEMAQETGWVPAVPICVMVLGTALAFASYWRFPKWPQRVAQMFKSVYAFLYHQWFFDALYRKFFVAPAIALGVFFERQVDQGVLDRFGPNGVASCVGWIGHKVRLFQTGRVYQYAFVLLLGVTVFVIWVLLLQEIQW